MTPARLLGWSVGVAAAGVAVIVLLVAGTFVAGLVEVLSR